MAAEGQVQVRGLRELNKAFKQLDGEIPKELRGRLLGIAERVASVARAGVPKLTGAAAGSIKPRASQKGAGIAFGGSAAPYYPWLDFGGRVGRNRSIARDVIKGGRYVYPAIASESDATAEAVDRAVMDAARSAGFETRGNS